MKEKILISIFLIVAMVVLGAALKYSIEKEETVQCLDWRFEALDREAYSERNPGGYYITGWQKDQCDRWKIVVPAVVR